MSDSRTRPARRPEKRPDIRFIPTSTDADKIRFFGNLMPAILLFCVYRALSAATCSQRRD
jgi:hypothetical protein